MAAPNLPHLTPSQISEVMWHFDRLQTIFYGDAETNRAGTSLRPGPSGEKQKGKKTLPVDQQFKLLEKRNRTRHSGK